MKNHHRFDRNSPANPATGSPSAFTLIELLVVMGIILILAALLVPMAGKAMHKARLAQTMSNGKSIYQALFAERLENSAFLPRTFGDRAYETSTDYWKDLVDGGHLDADFSFFSAPGVERYVGIDPEEFKPRHNAWCITGDVDEQDGNLVPLLFTRNLDIVALNEEPLLADVAPFGLVSAVVLHLGGDAHSWKPSELEEYFNLTESDLPVLRPGPRADRPAQAF